MFVVHEDMTIYATRGDVVYFQAEKKVGESKYLFQPQDIVRIKVYEKKNCSKVVLVKDFVVEEESTSVNIFLEKNEMKFGEIISKPKDYWYELELNPDTFPDTFVGYNENGPALFKLFPEGKDVVEGEIPDPEEEAAVSRMVVTFVNEYMGKNAETILRELIAESEYIDSIVQQIINGGHLNPIIRELLKDENLEKIVQEVVRDETIEAIVREIIEGGNLETIVQEIIKGENLETIIREILNEGNIEKIIQEILKENNIEAIIQEIVKPGHIETIIKELLKPENIDEITDEVVKDLVDRIPGAEVDDKGNIIINGEYLKGVVRSVNNVLPDANGNVTITIPEGGTGGGGGGTGNGTVTSVNGYQPDGNGNVEVPIPVIDNTLSIPGAAADAKFVGDALLTVGYSSWDGVLSVAETLAAMLRKATNLKATLSDYKVNIVETLEDGSASIIDIGLDGNYVPISITVDGHYIPVEWSGF